MEDILKFVTTEQSRRSEAFMFFWRILMAVLLTNHKMNELGYGTMHYLADLMLGFSEAPKLILFWFYKGWISPKLCQIIPRRGLTFVEKNESAVVNIREV